MTTLSHASVWAAIDAIAAKNELSPSGLARKAGLDPTTFNRSKRIASDGRERWPSTESIAKVLKAIDADIDEFMALMSGADTAYEAVRSRRTIPLLGLAQAGKGGFFDDGGFPEGQGWDEIEFPSDGDEAVYALEVTGDSMIPLYRDGDRIIVSPNTQVRRGDRVVVKTVDGQVMAKTLSRRTAKTIELESINPEHKNITFAQKDVEWMVRILWASQ
ncbi:MAG: helix-turn-helix transcriptional regulator [Hyphomicrobiales bacterium]